MIIDVISRRRENKMRSSGNRHSRRLRKMEGRKEERRTTKENLS